MAKAMETLREARASGRPLKLGVYLFDGYELLDAYGALEMFTMCNAQGVAGKRVFDVAVVGDGTTAFAPSCLVDFKEGDERMPDFDVLMLPGGNAWVDAIKRPGVVAWLSKAVHRATLVMSVCNGAGFLAALGVLDGRAATTNKIDLPNLRAEFPAVDWRPKARWQVDGKFYTSSGITAGTDLSLFIISELLGEKVAARVARDAEFQPIRDPSEDPFYGNPTFNWEGVEPEPQESMTETGALVRVVVLLYDNFELFDTFGPLEMFAVANRYKTELFTLTTVARTEIVKSSKGPSFRVDQVGLDVSQAPEADILLIPGGLGSLRESSDRKTLDWVRHVAGGAKSVMTVCTGSGILAAAGLLDGRRATTNKLSFNLIATYGRKVDWQRSARWVTDGKFWTSSGVAAGTDMTLCLLGEYFGHAFAQAVADRAEYVRVASADDDPFASMAAPVGLVKRVGLAAATSLLHGIFRTGIALGRDMNTSSLGLEI